MTRSCARSSSRNCAKFRRNTAMSAEPRSWTKKAKSTSRTSSPRKTSSSRSRTRGYLKRTPLSVYRNQGRGGKGRIGMRTRDEDAVTNVFVANTHSYMLVFTDRGRLYWLKVYEIPDVGAAGKGKAIVNLANLSAGRKGPCACCR